jgi:hypothetical protein
MHQGCVREGWRKKERLKEGSEKKGVREKQENEKKKKKKGEKGAKRDSMWREERTNARNAFASSQTSLPL